MAHLAKTSSQSLHDLSHLSRSNTNRICYLYLTETNLSQSRVVGCNKSLSAILLYLI